MLLGTNEICLLCSAMHLLHVWCMLLVVNNIVFVCLFCLVAEAFDWSHEAKGFSGIHQTPQECVSALLGKSCCFPYKMHIFLPI